MNSKEKIISLLTELGETVRAANGHVMVIGTLPTEEEDKRALILSIQGTEHMLSTAVAKMLSQGDAGSRIILRGLDIAAECIIKSRREEKKTEKKHNTTLS